MVHAPRSQVFRCASDWEHRSDWFEGVSGFRPTSTVTRGNGARYAYRARMMGIPASVETEIHDFTQKAGWTGVSTRGLPRGTKWVFEDQGDSAKFTYILEYRVSVPLRGPLLDSTLLQREWQRIIDESLQNLQAHFGASALEEWR